MPKYLTCLLYTSGVYATLVNKITNERMSIKTDQAVLLSVAADIEMYTTELVIKEISTPFNKMI